MTLKMYKNGTVHIENINMGGKHRITAANKTSYELINTKTGYAPDHIIIKRAKNDLEVYASKDADQPEVIFESFYKTDSRGLMGLAEDGLYYYYIPDTAQVDDYVTMLSDGAVQGHALGGKGFAEPWWVVGASVSSPWGWVSTAAFLGAAGVLVQRHRDEDKHAHSETPQPTPNQAPTDIILSANTLLENQIGAVIGALTTFDPDLSDTHTYTVSDNRFEVVNGKLKLKAGEKIEFLQEPSIRLTITSTDGANHALQKVFTLQVQDDPNYPAPPTPQNQHPTDITLSATQLMENQGGAVVGRLTTFDPDLSDVHTYTVSDDRFEVVNGELKLKAGVKVDFASEPNINVTITSTDQAGGKYSKNFILDTQDDPNYPAPTPTPNTSGVVTIQGEAKVGKTLNAVVADDDGKPNIIEYQWFVGGVPIQGATHSTYMVSASDVGKTITVQARYTDKAQHFEEPISIPTKAVIDVIMPPPVNHAPVGEVIITGKTEVGKALIASNTLGDVDGLGAITYHWFADGIQIGTGNTYTIQATDKDKAITVKAEYIDGKGVFESVESAPTTPITDPVTPTPINHAPSDITLSAVQIMENQEGAVVGKLTTTDPDQGDSHSYTVSDKRFEVVNDQLKLKAGEKADFAKEPNINLTITSIDKAGASYQEDFTLHVQDDPNYPVPQPPANQAPTDITLSTNRLPENKAGAVVGKLTTIDPDQGDRHSYIVSDQRFEVVNGELKLKAGEKVDFAQEPQIKLAITTSDKAGAQYSENFTLHVQDDPNYPAPNGGKLGVYVPKPATDFVANVKDYGAKGNGQSDDTAAIQKAIDAVAAKGGGIVEIPAGTYMVDAERAIDLKSHVIVRMGDDTVLKVKPNAAASYELFHIHNVENAHILGGTLEGDRSEHTGTAGEWGMGVRVTAAQNVVIEGVTVREMWGDGIYLGKAANYANQNENIVIYGVNMDHNRRQGISVTHGQGVKILDSVFQNTDGTDPRAGIDLEPNANESVRDVEIRGNQFLDNHIGFLVANHREPGAFVENVVFEDNYLKGNPRDAIILRGLEGGSIKNNTIHIDPDAHPHDSGGIRLYNGDLRPTKDVTISGNTLYGGTIMPRDTSGNTIADNQFKAAVFIRGNAENGEELTAQFYDGDGTSKATNLQYQWLANGVPIDGATAARYTPSAADRGKTLTVQVRFTDNAGQAETAESDATPPVENARNQTPTDIALSATTLPENQAGAIVGKLTTTDPDQGDKHTYTVSDQRFEVDAQGNLKLKAGETVEFAQEPNIKLNITTTDQGGASYQETFTLNVQDDPIYPAPNNGKLGVYVPKPATDFVANVKDAAYGAKGDGQSDDTAAIQKAIDAVAEKGGGIVDIPAGTYRINGAVTSVLGPGDVPRTSGLQVKSNVIIRMTDDTVMQVIPNGEKSYDIFNIYNAENVAIMGGTLQGDRHSHLNQQGEWGAGIKIASGKNVVVEKVIARDFWGDAVQISDSGSLPRTASENVTIYQLTADHNRRQGISIGFADKVLIEDSVFKNTGGQGGTPPMSGIDIEPENNEIASNITIKNSKFENNTGYGIILLERSDTTGADVRNVTIDGNDIKTSGAGIVVNNTGGHTITNNHISDIGKGWYYGSQHALALNANSHDNTVSGNTVKTGSIIDRGRNNTVSGNTFESVAFARGENKVGAVLTAEVHNDDGAPRNIRYQWLADGKKIDGATAATYTVRPEDAGKRISVEASFDKDGGGHETTLREVPTLPIENAATPDPNPPAGDGKLGVHVPKPVTDVVVNAKDFGAKGDGKTDDTAAIQKAIDDVAAKGGGVVDIPAGTYMVNSISNGGISVRSNVTVRMTDDTIVKAIPNGEKSYTVFRIHNADNAHILGGTIVGERDAHQGTEGEGGFGVWILSSQNVVVENVTAKNFWGDGFLVSRYYYHERSPENVLFYNVTADNNRRQGLSITDGNNIKVIKSVFKNTEGHSPESGIDIEPNRSEHSPLKIKLPDGSYKYFPGKVTNVEIIDSVFENNAGYGVIASANGDAVVENVRVINNRMDGNLNAITFNHVIGGEISGNTTLDDGRTIPYFDVDVYNNSQNIIVKDNTLYGGKVRTYEAGSLEGSGHQVSGNHTKAAVFIKGALKTGATVFAQPEDGNGVPLPKFIKYQWQINGKDIDGATAREYTIRPEDSGKSLSVRVEFPDGSKQTETAVSKPTPPIDSFKNNAAPTALELAGKALEVIEGKNGAVAGRVRGIDGDRGDDLSYRISDERFDIDAYGLIRLKPDQKLDYAQTQSIKVNVTAIDRAGNELSKPFTIAVKDDPDYTAPTPKPPATSGKLGVHVPKPVTDFVANAKTYGAKGDGQTDDTAAIQKAIDAAAEKGGGVVEIPAGTYMINTLANKGIYGISESIPHGLGMRSNVIVKMADDAVLKAIPHDKPGYSIFTFYKTDNAHIIGGTLIGERDEHQAIEGQWGMGVSIISAQNTVIEKVVSKDFWGDGFFVGINSQNLDKQSENITFYGVTADNNRRQGLSLVDGKNIKILNSTFKNTNGHMPLSGIDVEPNAGETVDGVEIRGNRFEGNSGFGIIVSGSQFNRPNHPAKDTVLKNVVIEDNTLINNRDGIWIEGVKGGRVVNNIIHHPDITGGPTGGERKLILDDMSENITVSGNTIYGGGHYQTGGGIVNEGVGNTIGDNAYKAAVYIRGTLKAGETLSAHIMDGDIAPIDGVQYQWLADGKPITGANGKTYTLTAGDSGKTITVSARFTDGAGQQEHAESAPSVPVGSPPENYAPSFLYLTENRGGTGANPEVPENQAGYIIGKLNTYDRNAGDNHTYRVNDERFEIKDGYLKLKDGQILDYDRGKQVRLHIETTDRAGAKFVYSDLVLQVTDDPNFSIPNHAPTSITVDNVSVAEKTPGAVIGKIQVLDPDAGDRHTFSFSDGRFEIENGYLKLKNGQALDYDQGKSIGLAITAKDLAGETYKEIIKINILDDGKSTNPTNKALKQVSKPSLGRLDENVDLMADTDTMSQSHLMVNPKANIGELKQLFGANDAQESFSHISQASTKTDDAHNTSLGDGHQDERFGEAAQDQPIFVADHQDVSQLRLNAIMDVDKEQDLTKLVAQHGRPEKLNDSQPPTDHETHGDDKAPVYDLAVDKQGIFTDEALNLVQII